MDIQSRFIHALRTQGSHKADRRSLGPWPCPYGHNGRMFQNVDQLLAHAKAEHPSEVTGLDESQERTKVREAVARAR